MPKFVTTSIQGIPPSPNQAYVTVSRGKENPLLRQVEVHAVVADHSGLQPQDFMRCAIRQKQGAISIHLGCANLIDGIRECRGHSDFIHCGRRQRRIRSQGHRMQFVDVLKRHRQLQPSKGQSHPDLIVWSPTLENTLSAHQWQCQNPHLRPQSRERSERCRSGLLGNRGQTR